MGVGGCGLNQKHGDAHEDANENRDGVKVDAAGNIEDEGGKAKGKEEGEEDEEHKAKKEGKEGKGDKD